MRQVLDLDIRAIPTYGRLEVVSNFPFVTVRDQGQSGVHLDSPFTALHLDSSVCQTRIASYTAHTLTIVFSIQLCCLRGSVRSPLPNLVNDPS
jgi:hypothetical protein